MNNHITEKESRLQTSFKILIFLAVLLLIVSLLVLAVFWMGQQVWIMSELKNKCISDCVAFNKDAIFKGIAERCVC